MMRACYAIWLTAVVLFAAGDREARAQGGELGWVTASFHCGEMNGVSAGVCDGAVMFENYVPVVVFGLNKRPNDRGRYTYFLLIKDHSGKRTGLNFKMEGSWFSSDRLSDGKTRLTLSGKQINFAYHFEADEATQALLEETVTIGGKVLKEGDPRVYLIDLTRDEVVYRPVIVDLSDEVPDLRSRERMNTWGDAVHRTIRKLKERSPEVRQFLSPRPGE